MSTAEKRRGREQLSHTLGLWNGSRLCALASPSGAKAAGIPYQWAGKDTNHLERRNKFKRSIVYDEH